MGRGRDSPGIPLFECRAPVVPRAEPDDGRDVHPVEGLDQPPRRGHGPSSPSPSQRGSMGRCGGGRAMVGPPPPLLQMGGGEGLGIPPPPLWGFQSTYRTLPSPLPRLIPRPGAYPDPCPPLSSFCTPCMSNKSCTPPPLVQPKRRTINHARPPFASKKQMKIEALSPSQKSPPSREATFLQFHRQT